MLYSSQFGPSHNLLLNSATTCNYKPSSNLYLSECFYELLRGANGAEDVVGA